MPVFIEKFSKTGKNRFSRTSVVETVRFPKGIDPLDRGNIDTMSWSVVYTALEPDSLSNDCGGLRPPRKIP